MNRSKRLQGKTRMCPFGKGYPSEAAARASIRGQREGAAFEVCPNASCEKWHVRNAPAQPQAPAGKKRPVRPGPSKRQREIVLLRDGACCFLCGNPSTEIHHRKRRSQGGGHEADNLITVCGPGNLAGCHGWIHKHPKAARDEGYLVRSDHDPAARALHHWLRGVVFLTSGGDFSDTPPEGSVAA